MLDIAVFSIVPPFEDVTQTDFSEISLSEFPFLRTLFYNAFLTVSF